MARFCDLGIVDDVVIGKGIEIEELFGKRLLVEKVIIAPSKFPGKNSSGLRMQMQICLATFNSTPDAMGDYFTKDANGNPIGERRSCFTGSDIMINEIKSAKQATQQDGKLFPIDTTIQKIGKCFKFT